MKYKTIVIDPPWDIKVGKMNLSSYRLGKEYFPYASMTDSEIINFPINDFADDECDLFLWVTHSKLPFGLEILKTWGFKYHVLLTWDKKNGVGLNGFYRRTEHVLYGYRKRMGVDFKEGTFIPTLFRVSRTVHSEKPSMFYEILRLRTKEPRIDIFARKRHYGFDAYGDQVETQIQQPLLVASLDDKAKVL